MKKKQLDSLDRRILYMLMQDANVSYVDIAKKIYVSAATVHVRVKNLKAIGVIQSAHTQVDLAILGLDVTAFLGIYLERSSYYTAVLSALQQLPEVTNVHYTTGEYNLFVKVICRDTKHLHDLLNYEIQNIKGVQGSKTFLSLDESINRPVSVLKEGDEE